MPNHDEQNTPDTPFPPLRVVLGRAGSGKTDWAVAHCLSKGGMLVASSPAQAESITEQVVERGLMNPAEARQRILHFRRLVMDIYQSRPEDGVSIMGRVFRRILVSHLVQRVIHPGDYLGRMLDAPGFTRALSDRLREWKLAGLTPDRMEAGAAAIPPNGEDDTFPRKMAELHRLFREYEAFLQTHRLRDDEDCLHLAARHAADSDDRAEFPPCLVVDGFYRFNRAQRELLAALAGRGLNTGRPEIETAVTLPFDAHRPLLFASVERTRESLAARFDVQEITLSKHAPARPPTLRHLEAGLWLPNAANTTLPPAPQEESANADAATLRIFNAPNPYTEAEMAARAFRRCYDEGGFAWSEFGIILRTLGDYAPILAAVFERYGIPLGVDGPEALPDNPLLATILHLFDILRNGWQRDHVLAFLKSSYTAPAKLEADAIRRLAVQKKVREGRDAWLRLAESANETGLHDAAHTLHMIAECEDVWARERAEPQFYAHGLQDAIARFGLVERVQDGEPVRAERDLAAWEMAEDTLHALAQMETLAGRELITFANFHDALLAGWQGAASLAEPKGDLVRVYEPFDSRERPLRVVAVMGLTERVFPRRPAEDPFLRDAERAALRQVTPCDLESQMLRADDERLFFYLAATAPAERLILSYPRSSGDSDALPSFYLDEVQAAFETVEGRKVPPPRTISRTLADVAPQLEDVVSDGDRLLAACAGLFEPTNARTETELEARQNQSAALLRVTMQDSKRQKIVKAALQSRNLPRLPRLEDAALRADFAGRKTVYSVSELEAHQRCPFHYLLRHVLRLHPPDEESLAQGNLLHDTLRVYFRRRQRKPAEEQAAPDAATMSSDLHGILRERMEKRPLDIAPHRQRMTQRLLDDALTGFAAREAQFTPQFQMRPAHFELAFGLSAGPIEDEERGPELNAPEGQRRAAPDPASLMEPLELTTSDGLPPVLLCGVIDRVDVDATGRRALVMDYKIGSPPDYAAVNRGASLQMPLYLLAMERLFDKTPAAACYDSARAGGRQRFHRMEHVNLRQFGPVLPMENGETVKPLNREQYAALMRQAEHTAVGIARDVETANVEARPGDHCRACAFSDVCRTSIGGGHDGESLHS